MNRAVAFLECTGPDGQGRMVTDYLAFSAADWEAQHDIIQWAFPTITPSAYNPDSETLTGLEVLTPHHQRVILTLFVKYLNSLGISTDPGEHGELFDFRLNGHLSWLHRGNHNYKRFTRIIECLKLFGLDAVANEFAKFLLFKVAIQHSTRIESSTVVFWFATWQDKRNLLPGN